MSRVVLGPTTLIYRAVVDPGVWRCGLAIFRADELIYASEPTDPGKTGRVARLMVSEAEEVLETHGALSVEWVSETPQSYPGKTGREGTLEELRQVVRDLDLWRKAGPKTRTYLPRKWKGAVPKPIHHARIRALLSETERTVIDGLARDRDAMDAVGLGLFHVGRCSVGGRRFEYARW
jgi:hypothetical protein